MILKRTILNGNLEKYFDVNKDINVILKIDSLIDYKFYCSALTKGILDLDQDIFLNQYGKDYVTYNHFGQFILTDEKYKVYSGNISSPNNEIQYRESEKGSEFTIQLSKLPQHIQKVEFIGCIICDAKSEEGIININSHKIAINQIGREELIYEFDKEKFKFPSDDVGKYIKCVLYLEFNRSDNVWKLNIDPNCLDLDYGEIEYGYCSESTAEKALREAINKYDLKDKSFEVDVAFPIIYQLKSKYVDGTMRNIFNTIVPIAIYFIKNKPKPAYSFDYWCYENMPTNCWDFSFNTNLKDYSSDFGIKFKLPKSEKEYYNNLEYYHNSNYNEQAGSSMNFLKLMSDLILKERKNRTYGKSMYIIVVVNNENKEFLDKDEELKKLLNESKQYKMFWQFIGISNDESLGYGVFDRLDEISDKPDRNFNFFDITDFNNITIQDWYDKLIGNLAASVPKSIFSSLLGDISNNNKSEGTPPENNKPEIKTEDVKKIIEDVANKTEDAKKIIKNAVINKDRKTAGLLSIFLGAFGAHKFYLNNKKMGIIYLLFSITGIPAFLGIYEGIRFFMMSDEEFKNKYNIE